MKANKRLFTITALALVTGFSWWLLRDLTPTIQMDRAASNNEPDYFLENFNVKVMDENGKPQRELFADNMYHYSLDDRATLKNPRIIFYSDSIASWDIRADGGVVTAGGKSILFSGKVLMKRINGAASLPAKDAMEIITSDLLVKPDEKYAETERPVKIRDYRGITDAVGMHADLKARRLVLLSQVKGVYDPLRD